MYVDICTDFKENIESLLCRLVFCKLDLVMSYRIVNYLNHFSEI